MYFGQARPVEKYDRKIKYLDYTENGVRIRGAGFVKLERRDGICCVTLQIGGLYRKDRFTRPLLLLSGEEERELCRLQLVDGGGKLCLEKLNSGSLDGRGLRYEDVTGLRVPIMEGKEIRCQWGERPVPEPVPPEPEVQIEGVPPEPEVQIEGVPVSEPEPAADPQIAASGRTEPAVAEPSRADLPFADPPPLPAVILEDKWEQLWAIYPHIAPFHDAREYLSMGPSDFVILPRQFYKLANNSFLLHGYYNYRHLIMTRAEQKNGMKYYIGVPGNYYEREKKIAVMFGFESFECGIEPAEEGDFGYYMIAVEL